MVQQFISEDVWLAAGNARADFRPDRPVPAVTGTGAELEQAAFALPLWAGAPE